MFRSTEVYQTHCRFCAQVFEQESIEEVMREVAKHEAEAHPNNEKGLKWKNE